MKTAVAALLLCCSMMGAQAFELSDLAPCKPAAARYCDRTGGMSMANLFRCGATLAALSEQIPNSCRAVLKRYGQLN